ncbi:MAG: sialidase family protein, partial [bacterium]
MIARRMFFPVLLAGLIVLSSVPATAQTVVATGVSEDATEAASEAKIARDPRGGVHLTFVKPSAAFDQIHVASSTDGGSTWRTVQVTNLRVHSRYPTLAAGPNAILHLAWTTYEPIGHIYYSRFDGFRWSVPLKISPGDAYAGVPAIAVDQRGDPHIVWYGIRDQAPQ